MARIGPRNVKTALAVFICILISRLLRLEYPFYAAIAAIISMESSIAASLRAGKNRMLGTGVGAVIGLLCALNRPGNAILCGVGIVIVIYLCNLLGWSKAVSIAGVVFLAIMLNLGDKSPFLYSFNRLLDTFIGITVAVVVNQFFMPPNHWALTLRRGQQLNRKTVQILEKYIRAGEPINIESYRKEVSAYKRQLVAFHEDLRYLRKNAADWNGLRENLDLFYKILDELQALRELPTGLALNDENRAKLQKLSNGTLARAERETPPNEAAVVYNYHLGKLLTHYERICLRIDSLTP